MTGDGSFYVYLPVCLFYCLIHSDCVCATFGCRLSTLCRRLALLPFLVFCLSGSYLLGRIESGGSFLCCKVFNPTR